MYMELRSNLIYCFFFLSGEGWGMTIASLYFQSMYNCVIFIIQFSEASMVLAQNYEMISCTISWHVDDYLKLLCQEQYVILVFNLFLNSDQQPYKSELAISSKANIILYCPKYHATQHYIYIYIEFINNLLQKTDRKIFHISQNGSHFDTSILLSERGSMMPDKSVHTSSFSEVHTM